MEIRKVFSEDYYYKVVDKNGNTMGLFYGNSEKQAYYRACVFCNACNYEVGNLNKLINLKQFYNE